MELWRRKRKPVVLVRQPEPDRPVVIPTPEQMRAWLADQAFDMGTFYMEVGGPKDWEQE